MRSRTGGCACGAVRYRIDAEITRTGACHCETCRRWSGGVFMSIEAKGDAVTFTQGTPQVWRSSHWAERGFCAACGGTLFYRVTAPRPMEGDFHFGFGTLDDQSAVALTDEIYFDCKADGYAFAGDTKKLTRAETIALFTK
ncbi:GFA family protein [Pseudaestuariivita sp.]|uniref:GFA family protein n=1 Tax=Pseudaestuariivita sp. TaxID=2211669 RepID=UPI0040584FCB